MTGVVAGAGAEDCRGNKGDGCAEYSDCGVPGVGGAMERFDGEYPEAGSWRFGGLGAGLEGVTAGGLSVIAPIPCTRF